MATISLREYVLQGPHAVPIPKEMPLVCVSVHQDLLVIMEFAQDAPLVPFGAQRPINASMSVDKIPPIPKLLLPVYATLAMDSLEAHVKLVLLITSFLMDTASHVQSTPTIIQPRRVVSVWLGSLPINGESVLENVELMKFITLRHSLVVVCQDLHE